MLARREIPAIAQNCIPASHFAVIFFSTLTFIEYFLTYFLEREITVCDYNDRVVEKSK
jgi:hypothetical protein